MHGDDLIAATEGRAIWVLDDVAPLREIAQGAGSEPTHLFTPATAFRVHPNNNEDTPLPPETPSGDNPPAGAIIDYRLAGDTKGPVTLTILDGAGQVVRRFASDAPPKELPAERYFAKGWLSSPARPSAAPGLHRFVWDLHHERPEAMRYGFSIAAVWGHGTPIEPEGPWALPGDYTVVLEADGKRLTAPLTIVEDPRVTASADDLRMSFAFSQSVDAALADASAKYRDAAALAKLLDMRFPKNAKAVDPAALESLRRKPPEGSPTFQSVATALAGIETALESADAAPTDAQRQFVDDQIAKLAALKAEWTAKQAGPLAELNAALARAGQQPVTLAEAEKLPIETPDDGEDLP